MIVVVAPTHGLGGAEIATYRWAVAQAVTGEAVEIISAAPFVTLLRQHDQLHRVATSSSQGLAALLSAHVEMLRQILRRDKPRLVVLCNTLAGPLAIVARVYGKSTTFAYHDYLPTQSWKRQLVAVVGMFMASRVLVPSRGSFAALPRQIKGKTQVVNNDRGVIEAPLSAHCQALLAKWNLAANKAARGDGLRVIVVGRVEHNKGLGELLQDLPQGMVKEVLCLGAIGDEKLWRDLQEIGTKRNIALRNTCCELAQVAVHYRDADLCIHYSRYESTTPFAFSDAWRFGVPAFVRDVPVATEFASSTFVIKDAGSLRGRFALTPLVILDAIQEQIHLLFAPSFLGRTECSPMSGETDGLNK